MTWRTVIGLEIHAQLSTRTKAFCACSTRFGDLPNRNTCPVCLGMPGALPVLNHEAVDLAVKAALSLHCQVRQVSVFARKNYFYPDLPKGYQITQYDRPLAEHGTIEAPMADGALRRIRIRRVHMEEDAGKSIHLPRGGDTLVDFNRCGVPLVEIVTEPDITSPEEAAACLKELRDVLRFIDACDGNMEQGSFRCDANVSVMREGDSVLGTRTELKNLNSFRFVQRGLEHEVQRHVALLESGIPVVQETRLFDSRTGLTHPMRSKEEAHDYRYFPEPDLQPLVVDSEWTARAAAALPPVPADFRRRMMEEYGLPFYDAEVLSATRDVAEYALAVLASGCDPKLASNWLMTEVLAVLKSTRSTAGQFPVAPSDVAGLVRLLSEQKLSVPLAKEVFARMWSERVGLAQCIRSVGTQVNDEDALVAVCRSVVDNAPAEVAKYLAGKTQIVSWFVGQAMGRTRGTGNPRMLTRIFTDLLEGRKNP
jgi:aspartyl-tRNA(Asn)/glutamyl-tRNA(Gln) amidotransferase subunit B